MDRVTPASAFYGMKRILPGLISLVRLVAIQRVSLIISRACDATVDDKTRPRLIAPGAKDNVLYRV